MEAGNLPLWSGLLVRAPGKPGPANKIDASLQLWDTCIQFARQSSGEGVGGPGANFVNTAH